MGGYPTTSVLDAPGSATILGDKSNATVQELSMLLGVGGDGDLGDDHILSNRLFTTVVGGYTNVPTEAQFGMFREAIVRYRRDLLEAGVQVSRRLREIPFSEAGNQSIPAILHPCTANPACRGFGPVSPSGRVIDVDEVK